MTLIDIIIIGVILLVVGGALAYVIVSKKRGAKCVGCPDAKKCAGKCNCHNHPTEKQD